METKKTEPQNTHCIPYSKTCIEIIIILFSGSLEFTQPMAPGAKHGMVGLQFAKLDATLMKGGFQYCL